MSERPAKRPKHETPSIVATASTPTVATPKPGAIVCKLSYVHEVQKLLKKVGWIKKGRCVTPVSAECAESTTPHLGSSPEYLKAVHVNPRYSDLVAQAFKNQAMNRTDTNDDINVHLAKLLQLLGDGQIAWLPNIKVGDCEDVTSCRQMPSNIKHNLSVVKSSVQPWFTFSEFFAGIGGFRVGLEAIGGTSVFSCEFDEEAADTYARNFGETVTSKDVCDVPTDAIPPHDILTGGFPCQSFTAAGPQRGFSDDNGLLFFQLLRFLKQSDQNKHRKPKSFLLENVSSLVTMDNGETFKRILAELESCGYHVLHKVYNSNLLVPQSRNRVYIVGFLKEFGVMNTTQDYKGSDVDETEAAKRHPVECFAWPTIPNQNRKVKQVLQSDPQNLLPCLTPEQWEKVKRIETKACEKRHPSNGNPDEFIAKRLVDVDSCSKTLMSSYKRAYTKISEFVSRGDKLPPRYFTPRECARLQGFPETYQVDPPQVCKINPNRIYHQLGNAVSPPIVGIIACHVAAALRKRSPTVEELKGAMELISLK